MERQATRFAHDNARRLRKNLTDGEQRLWYRLRRRQLGARFRRQHPFGAYIADFACLDPKIVIEIDGSQHASAVRHDAAHDAYFLKHGFVVLRVNADEALSNTDGVLELILETIERQRSIASLPDPSPEGEGAMQEPTP